MKRKFILFPVLILSIFNIYAQEQLPVVKKMTFGKDNKLYIQKELGAYLWLSTSSDKDSDKIRLMSDSSKTYSNPMFFDTEGYNTVRSPTAVDTVSKRVVYPIRDVIFEVYADGLAPTTHKVTISKSSKTIKNEKYYGDEVVVVLKSKDAVSGVENIYYSLENNDFVKYTDSIKLSSEGRTIFKYYSTDRVGNRELAKREDINIDLSPPETSFEIDGILNEKYVAANAKIKLDSKDNLSGIKGTYYKINNGPVKYYSYPIPISWIGKDGHITFWAVDNLNNKEKEKLILGSESPSKNESAVFVFYIDNTPPSINLEFEGTHTKGKYMYISGNTKLKINADDDKSGVDKIKYSINNKSVDKQYDEFIEFSDVGVAYIRVVAKDFVGNSSPTVTKTLYVDATAPSSIAYVLSPKSKIKDTVFITKNTQIKITASDKASGTKNISYKINSGQPLEYSSPFRVEGEGLSKIYYWAIDNVDNKEEEKSLEVFLDNKPPKIYHHYSDVPIGTKKVREEEYTIYPSNVKLYIAATDAESGGEKIEYKINNGPLKTTNPIKTQIAGNYDIEVAAYDILGNSSTEVIRFSVEN